MAHKLTFIGAGNVAWHLAPALEAAGFIVNEVYSQSPEHARQLVRRLYNARQAHSIDFSESESDTFILTVPDLLIGTVAHSLKFPENAILLHTSGSQPLSVFEGLNLRKGVLYPLQTFSKQKKKVDFKKIAVCIESDDGSVLDWLAELAYGLSDKVYQLDSEERKRLHLAAVFACNFTNHCLTIAESLTKEAGLSFEFLAPLVQETIEKALKIGPKAAQTGPAIRNDKNTLSTHLTSLSDEQEYWKAIYSQLSADIQRVHGIKKPEMKTSSPAEYSVKEEE